MVLHTSRVMISWRFHFVVSHYKLETDKIPQVSSPRKRHIRMSCSLVILHRFSPNLFSVSLSVSVFGQDYDPMDHQSAFQFPVEKDFYLPWVAGIPHGNREHIHGGLIQWAPQLLLGFTHPHLCISCQPEHPGEGTFPAFPSYSSLTIPGSTVWISTFHGRKLKLT